MNQTAKRKRFGPRRVRCMPEGLRQKLNKLLLFGFSPIETKRILGCLYGSRVSIVTLKKQRRFLYRMTQENNKDFKFRYKQLGRGKLEWIPEYWLNYYEEPSEFPVTLPSAKAKVVEEEQTIPEVETETEYSQKKVKVLIGKPLD